MLVSDVVILVACTINLPSEAVMQQALFAGKVNEKQSSNFLLFEIND